MKIKVCTADTPLLFNS